ERARLPRSARDRRDLRTLRTGRTRAGGDRGYALDQHRDRRRARIGGRGGPLKAASTSPLRRDEGAAAIPSSWMFLKAAATSVFALAIAATAPPARAELVGQFDAGLRNVQRYGAYTVVASGRVYETSGAPAPILQSAVIHFPRGASLRSEFLVSRFFCDGTKLQKNPDPALCARSHFASGTMMIDARPAIEDAFSVD